jgi:hypothetical protein
MGQMSSEKTKKALFSESPSKNHKTKKGSLIENSIDNR